MKAQIVFEKLASTELTLSKKEFKEYADAGKDRNAFLDGVRATVSWMIPAGGRYLGTPKNLKNYHKGIAYHAGYPGVLGARDANLEKDDQGPKYTNSKKALLTGLLGGAALGAAVAPINSRFRNLLRASSPVLNDLVAAKTTKAILPKALLMGGLTGLLSARINYGVGHKFGQKYKEGNH